MRVDKRKGRAPVFHTVERGVRFSLPAPNMVPSSSDKTASRLGAYLSLILRGTTKYADTPIRGAPPCCGPGTMVTSYISARQCVLEYGQPSLPPGGENCWGNSP